MHKNGTPVLVQRLPEGLNAAQVQSLKRDLDPFVRSDHPRIVFDLSQVQEMDAAGVDMLLDCMTEVAKRDGDLKLAAPTPRALVILELTQLDRLFEVFETAEEAAASFGGVVVTANSRDLLFRDPDGTESRQQTGRRLN